MLDAIQKTLIALVDNNTRGYTHILKKKYPSLEQNLRVRYGNEKSLGEMLYCLYNNDKVSSSCLHCGEPTKFKQFSHGYFDYCSYSCRAKAKKSHMNVHNDPAAKKKAIKSIKKTSHIALEKRKKTSKDRHGVEHFAQHSDYRSKVLSTMVERYGTPIAQHVHLAEDQKSLLVPNSEILKSLVQSGESTESIAHRFGVSRYSVWNRAVRDGLISKKSDRSISSEEREIAALLDEMGVVYETNRRDIIQTGELDIYLPAYNLAIEYCGLYWHSTRNPVYKNDKNRHFRKYKECSDKNIKLITIFSDEWHNNKDICVSRIKHLVGKTERRIFARKTECLEIESSIGRKFLQANHIAGPANSSVYYGLYLEGELMSVMSFGSARYRRGFWELHRFASIHGSSVIGGASKLFSKFRKDYPSVGVVSYSDNRWGSGDFYTSLGFDCISEGTASYFYTDKSGLRRWHRSRFQKHKIVKEFGEDSTLTEEEIMEKNGFYRVYDCGSKTWIIAPDLLLEELKWQM